MKKQTNLSANNADFSALEMWLNSESKLFTSLFAEKGESITRKKALAALQVFLSLVVLITFNFANPLISLICVLWLASSVIIVKSLDTSSYEKGDM